MDYSVTLLNGDYAELPKYNMAIAEKLESTDEVLSAVNPFKVKTKKAYDCVCFILGKEKVKEVLGDFSSIDPNEVHLTYMSIVDAYNEPIRNEQQRQIDDNLEKFNIDKVAKMVDTAEKAQRFEK